MDRLDQVARQLNISRNAIIKLLIVQNVDSGIKVPNINSSERD